MKLAFVITLSIALVSYSNAGEVTQLVDAHLRQMFPSSGHGITYIESLSAPVQINALVLRRVLPHTLFYHAKLRTNHFEYLEVEILIAVTRTKTVTKYSHCFSPIYEKTRPEFLAVFSGIRAASPTERDEVARAIAELFAAITYNGHVGAIRQSASSVEVELWYGDLMWRYVTLTFKGPDIIESIKLVNPKDA